MPDKKRPGDPGFEQDEYGLGDDLSSIWDEEDQEDVEIELKPISDEEFMQDVDKEEEQGEH